MENANNMTRLQKLTFSAMVMALYIVVLCLTSSFSFGAYQIRIATSLYALAYLFPFLVVPLGLANLLSNMLFGGFGVADMLGGFPRRRDDGGLHRHDTQEKLEPHADSRADCICPRPRRGDLSVLHPGDTLSADGAQPLRRTANSIRRGRCAGEASRTRAAALGRG